MNPRPFELEARERYAVEQMTRLVRELKEFVPFTWHKQIDDTLAEKVKKSERGR